MADIDFKDEAEKYRAAGYGVAEAQACLDDFRKQGNKEKVAFYEGLVAALGGAPVVKPKGKKK